MLHVDLHDRPAWWRLLPRGPQQPLHVPPHLVLVGHQAGRGVGQAGAGPHQLDPVGQGLTDALHQRTVLLHRLLELLPVLLIFQVQLTLGHRLQRMALELAQVVHQPLVDGVREQQHLAALLPEHLQVRAAPRRLPGVGDVVVDGLLSLLHARDVVGQRDPLLRSLQLGAGKAQQLRDALAVVGVLDHPLLEHPAEVVPEGGVLLLVLRQLLQHPQHLLHRRLADGVDGAVALQDLARDVERQVVRIDQPAHEAQPGRHQFLGVVHDEDPLDVELDAVAPLTVPQVEGGAGGDVEQQGVLQLALYPAVDPGQRRLDVVAKVLIETLVLLVGDLLAIQGPQRLGVVDHLHPLALFPGHVDGQIDVVRVLVDYLTQPCPVQELLLLLAQMQDHLGAAPLAGHGLDGVLALAIRGPAHPLLRLRPGAPAQ